MAFGPRLCGQMGCTQGCRANVGSAHCNIHAILEADGGKAVKFSACTARKLLLLMILVERCNYFPAGGGDGDAV